MKTTHSQRKERAGRVLVWGGVFLLLAAIWAAQNGNDIAIKPLKAEVKTASSKLQEPMVPTVQALRFMSLGQPQLVADLLWLQMIQYFGQGNPYGKYMAMGPMLDRITQLDPKFEYAYEFGMVTLPFMDQTDTALTLGDRAEKALPNVSLLTYYQASNYHLYKKNYRKASELYAKAAEISKSPQSVEPSAPGAAAQLAAITKSQVNDSILDRYTAYVYWNVAASQSSDDKTAEQYLNWADNMTIVYLLERTAADMQQKHGAYPASLQEIVNSPQWVATLQDKNIAEDFSPSLQRLREANNLQAGKIPTSPVKRVYTFDQKTGRVAFDTVAD
jgi:tetratricopeptide (TPR) repeat protein